MCRRLTAAAILAVAASLLAPASAIAAEGTRAVYLLRINGIDAGETVAAVEDGRIWIPADVLRANGLHWTRAERRELEGRVYVQLDSLEPRVTYQLDAADAALDLSATAASFQAMTVIQEPRSPHAVQRPRDLSAVLNYGLTVGAGASPLYATELGVAARGVLARASLAVLDGRLLRGPASVLLDDERRLVRWEAGELVAASTLAVPEIVGLRASRNFELDSTFVPYAGATLAGVSASPAVADVYVNGQLVHRASVQPGRFEVRDLGIPSGLGDVRVVLHDAFGRSSEFARTFYRAPQVLRRGLHQFHYTAGVPRARSARLGTTPVAAVAEHRLGVTDNLTIGGTAHTVQGRSGGGLGVALRPGLGELALGLTARPLDSNAHTAGSLGYLLRSRRLSASASLQAFAGASATGELFDGERPRVEQHASIDFPSLRHVSVGLRQAHSRLVTGGTLDRFGLTSTIRLPARASLSVLAARELGPLRRTTDVSVFVTVPLGARDLLTIGRQAAAGRSRASVTLQHAAPQGPGLGYRVGWTPDDDGVSADLAVRGRAGQIEVRHAPRPGAAATSLQLSGALVAIGGRVHPARPVHDAYALVRVAGVPGVRAYAGNQFVGRTNRRGEVLVPSLPSYYPNRISIDDRDLPFSHHAERTDALMSPSFRAGGVVDFPVRALRLVSGRFRVAGEPADVAHGDAAVSWGLQSETVPLGPDGEFLFEQALDGAHDVRIVSRQGQFTCRLAVPPLRASAASGSGEPSARLFAIAEVGDVACAAAPAAAGAEGP